MARIVVGIDGSDGATRALCWAAEEARLRSASIDVVHAWVYPSVIPTAIGVIPPMPPPDKLHELAAALVDQVVSARAHELEGVEIRRLIVQGPAAQALINAGRGADLLVVGSRGRGGFAGLL